MKYLDELYENYVNSPEIMLSASGKWCKAVKNVDNEYYHPELYTKNEFLKMIKEDTEFSEKWLILK